MDDGGSQDAGVLPDMILSRRRATTTFTSAERTPGSYVYIEGISPQKALAMGSDGSG